MPCRVQGAGPRIAPEERHARVRRQVLKDGVLVAACVVTLAAFQVGLLLANRESMSPESSLPDLAGARRAQADFLGLAWWRIRVGSDWGAPPD
ncbi:MAG: hypothetical protein ACKVXR_13640 [Planctomycetota bacterium]